MSALSAIFLLCPLFLQECPLILPGYTVSLGTEIRAMSVIPAPQAQWALDNTAGGILSLARGFIQAATTDNVQMLALLACEQFGSTLPINTTTRIKVELLARRSDSKSLSFLKSMVGFSAGDSADVLSRSDGGVRFLSFAAILVSWGTSLISSAELLDSLIRDTANKNQPMPTLLQLKDLLQALTPKLISSGLTADVLGWRDWFERFGASTRLAERVITPGVQEMREFLNALRNCFRIGEQSTIRVETCMAYVPFSVAVIKWTLGKPPNIEGIDGSNWLESDLDGICVMTSPVEGRFLVSIFHAISSPEQLISVKGIIGPLSGVYDFLGGSLDVKLWANARLKDLELQSVLCGQVLYYIIEQLVPKITLSDQTFGTLTQAKATSRPRSLPEPFGDSATRLNTIQYILGDSLKLPTQGTEPAKLLSCIKNQHSLCHECKKSEARESDVLDHEGQLDRDYMELDKDNAPAYSSRFISEGHKCFEARIGAFAADLLALSLFASENTILDFPNLKYPDFRSIRPNQSWSHDFGSMSTYAGIGKSEDWNALIVRGWWPSLAGHLHLLCCPSYSVFSHVLDLTSDQEHDGVIISADHGQVIYPSVLGAHVPSRDAHLQLKCIPGQLCWNRQTIYAFVSDADKLDRSPLMNNERYHPKPTAEVLGASYIPIPRLRASRLQFFIDLTNDRMEQLNISVGWERKGSRAYLGAGNAWDLIDGVCQTVFSPPCRHKADAPVGNIGEDFYLDKSYLDAQCRIRTYRRGETSLLIPLHGDHTSQLLQLAATPERCVLHRDGCLGCALRLAKELSITTVIC